MIRYLLPVLLTIAICLPAHSTDSSLKIISLAPSVTQSLYQLGVERNIIGITVHCPPGTVQKEIIGTLLEPNIEKIVALQPDLVIATKEGNRPGTVYKLQKLGIRVFTVTEDCDFNKICENFIILGTLVGEENKAKEIVQETRKKISSIVKRLNGQKPVRVFWEVGARPLFTISRRSFVHGFNEYAGGMNIFDDITSRYPRISREEVVRRNPEAIIIVAMGDVSKNEQDYWQQFKTVDAVRSNRIFVIDSQEIFTPTPLTFLKGIEVTASLLHPETFNEKKTEGGYEAAR